jgi:hypothetical protein
MCFTQGCVTIPWGLKKERQELVSDIKSKTNELDRHLRSYVTGTVESLAYSTDKNKEEQVAFNLAMKAQEIVGLPDPGDKIHTIDVIDNNNVAIENLSNRERNVVSLARQKQVLGHELINTEDQLIELGEASRGNENFFSKMWGWLIATFGLIGAIAVLVIGAPALLPIVGQLIAWVVTKIPGLVGWMGLTSFSLTKNIIKGVHDVKEKIKLADEERTFSKNEVLNLFKSNLGNSTNHSDKNIISRIKRKF